MATIAELTVQLMTARLTKRDLSFEELQKEMDYFAVKLRNIDAGLSGDPELVVGETAVTAGESSVIDFKKIFKKDEVVCLLCNKAFKTLKRHLTKVHQITDKAYKAQFGIDPKQHLVAKSYSDRKKADAQRNNLGAKMQAARKAKASAVAAEKTV